ncbi:hypothetical protein [Amycolatopsis sp. cmx-11-12]|uniref:hypothetical protein n=1 Tax=Amycolatopsis sp. cmx-11-12 TaxID=2785795 RepID=UPI003917C54B
MAAFPVAGQCARLITTRTEFLVDDAVRVRVDQVTAGQAEALLVAGLPAMPAALRDELIEATGCWPLLLRLINKVLADQLKTTPDIAAVAGELLRRLRRRGAAHIDQLSGATREHLDVDDPEERRHAVAATIEASRGLLRPAERTRFRELAIFAEDEAIPIALISQLWKVTGKLDLTETRTLCARLNDLALLTSGDETVTLHDVVRDFLGRELEDHVGAGTTELNRVLVEAVAGGLPTAPVLPSSDGFGEVAERTAWWELDGSARYLADHLVEHLLAAERDGDAEAVVSDLRWVASRLRQAGPIAPYADLARVGTPLCGRLQQLLGQTAHLLAPTTPAHSQLDVLYSRVAHDPFWGGQAAALAEGASHPRLANRWPLPDLPDPLLRRILSSHAGVKALVMEPGGTWLAAATWDGTVRLWDVTTGQELNRLDTSTAATNALAVAPDATWLAGAGSDDLVRIWEVATRRERGVLEGHSSEVTAMVVAPNGEWLASADRDGVVRIWDVRTRKVLRRLTGHTGVVNALAVAPDGAWLASATQCRAVQVWDTMTWQKRTTSPGETWDFTTLAVAPDGSWLAGAGDRGVVQIWDMPAMRERAQLTGHAGVVKALAAAPDGTWLASAGGEGTVRIWDVATQRERLRLPSRHNGCVTALAAAPDGTSLAIAGLDGLIRIWDASSERGRSDVRSHHMASVTALASGQPWLAGTDGEGAIRIWDGESGKEQTRIRESATVMAAITRTPWLATASSGGRVRLWDTETGREHALLGYCPGGVSAMAFSPGGNWLAAASAAGIIRIWDPVTFEELRRIETSRGLHTLAVAADGSWLTTGHESGTVQLWDVATGQARAKLTGHSGIVSALAVAPSGEWLATAGWDGTARIWDASTGTERAVLTGHRRTVSAIVIAPSGEWLATAGWDGTARIWDTSTYRPIAMMRVSQAVHTCVVTSDGHGLAVGGPAGLYMFGFHPGRRR